jgi:hypothetical protein
VNQPTLLEKARQGDDEAIAAVLNYLLKDRNITATVAIKGNRLLVLLKSASVPEQESSVAVVRKLMQQLNVESIQFVEVYGKEIGQQSTAWRESLDLTAKAENNQKLSRFGKLLWAGKLKLKEGLGKYPFINNLLDKKNKKLFKTTLIISLIPLVAVGIYLGSKLPQLSGVNPSVPVASQSPLPKPSPSPIIESSPIPSPSPISSPQSDVFREAVNKAISAAQLTQSAKSKGEWNQVANQWESAIALMKTVPESSQNYPLAQKKAIEYQGNLEYANRAANLAQ